MAQILFVDDDPITLNMLCKVATLAGHDPITARSGAQALEIATERSPDLIILDMMMPDLDGLGVLARLRANAASAQIPVVVLSAGAELDAAERVQAAGGQAYLVKPISMDQLIEVIREHTDG